jgi:flagellar biosynthesis protein FlhF
MADGYRLGAAEQLGAYARLLGVPMHVARDGDELRAAVAAMADREAIYVDTAGVGGDVESAAALRALVRAVPDIETVAVVSASTSATALAHAAARLVELAPSRAVVTKLDEGGGLGTTCSWLADAGIRLAWLGTGPRVPEDLAAASGATLARWLRAA